MRLPWHTTAIPIKTYRAEVGACDYHIYVHRFDHFENFFVYPIFMEERLPCFDLPLLPGDGFVPLDLQVAFDRSYETGPYRKEIDYATEQLIPSVSAKRKRWIKSLINEAKSGKTRVEKNGTRSTKTR